jgi:cysteine desulfurase
MSNIIYLDNAATTSIDSEVLAAMMPYMSEHYGNPSSSYSLGRASRMAIESARKQVADMLGVKPTTIYFTSGGTESNNTAIASAIKDLGCDHIITSPIEHHAVLHTVEYYCKQHGVSSSFIQLHPNGSVNLENLEEQLIKKSSEGKKCLVSLMHANNEIGTLLDINLAGEICSRYESIFHSDCVQTIGHYPIDLKKTGVNFASASGHKFHGPKGTGILYVSEGSKFGSLIHGGGQERKKRAGTENVHGIIGFTKALALSMENNVSDQVHIRGLNNRMRDALTELSEDISFNNSDDSLFTVLSVNFPQGTNTDLMLALLDRKGICASGGSACSSGEDSGSHVISALGKEINGATLRFSFSKQTTVTDIDTALSEISSLLALHTQKVQA